jgi:hypothetical protein
MVYGAGEQYLDFFDGNTTAQLLEAPPDCFDFGEFGHRNLNNKTKAIKALMALV